MKALLTNPRAFALIVALIIVAGLAALSSLPRNEDPRIANRNGLVLTEFAGASAERVEALVTEPLERRLREIPEIEHIDSRSSAGFSLLAIELVDEVGMHNTDTIWAEVRDKLEQAGPLLPPGAGKPFVEDRLGYAFTMIVALTWDREAPDASLLTLGRYAQELRSRLRSIPGTDFISLHGDPEEEVVVDVDVPKAALLGFSPHYIGEQVFEADAKIVAGEIHNQRQRVAVEVEGAFDTLERIRSVPLRQGEHGRAVVVGDVADVYRSAKTPARDLAVVDGQPAVVVGVRMLANQRSDIWSAKVRQLLEDMEGEFPSNVELQIIFDQEQYTTTRLDSLIDNILLGFGLIVLVLLGTLGWRAALIVAMALPLTVLFAFACMNLVKLPIHQMSVTGLIVALGIMVDNAIVMVDTVNRYKQEGMSGLKATQMALRHLWLPLLGSTLTTMLAFTPIVVMPGASGEFVGGIGLTVIFSLLGSYLISHLVIAGLAGRFLVREPQSHWWQQGLRFPGASQHFKRSIAWAVAHPKQAMLLVLLLPLTGFIASQSLTEQFFPPADRDMVNLEVFLPASASIDQTRQLTEQLSALINQESQVENLHWFIGANAPSFYYNMKQGKDGSQYYAQGMLSFVDYEAVPEVLPRLQQQLDDRFPEAQIIFRRLEQGPPFDAPVELRVVGHDLQTLQALGDELRLRVLGLQDVVHVRNSLSEAVPKIWMAVNEHDARAGQLSLTDIANQLHEGVDGAITGSVLEGTQSLPVRVQAKGQRRIDINGVNSWLLIAGKEDSVELPIPYASIGDVEIRPAIGSIPRRDGERVNTVQIYIRDGVLPATVLARVTANLDAYPLALPAGYKLEVAGEDAKRDEAVGKLLGSMGIIFVLLVVAIVMSFNSFRLSVTVFLVAFQAAGLGLLALSISRAPFGFTAVIGLMGLIGLAINAAIVILAELKTDPEAVAGNKAAIVAGTVSCSRHIVSTTITTVMGFLPLILSGGAFWAPFAFVIAGGTTLTTVLSFYFVPAIFSLMARRRAFELSEVEQGALQVS